MSGTDLRELSFVDDFHDFYAEVIRLRCLAESGVIDAAASDGESGYENQAEMIRVRLVGLMERSSLFAGRNAGELGFGLYREVQYVMAALADETFLRLDWRGNDYWTEHLLETQLFNSHNAGEELFARLDRLLDQPERSYTDIYAVYLMALALGFRGKYWGVDDNGRLEGYRQRLFVRIYRRRPDLFGESGRLFPDSYRHTLDEGIAKKLPSPVRWFGGLVLAVLAWVVIAHVLWQNVTEDLDAKARAIKNAPSAATVMSKSPQGAH
jgi:type VI secretion system protein ImpK